MRLWGHHRKPGPGNPRTDHLLISFCKACSVLPCDVCYQCCHAYGKLRGKRGPVNEVSCSPPTRNQAVRPGLGVNAIDATSDVTGIVKYASDKRDDQAGSFEFLVLSFELLRFDARQHIYAARVISAIMLFQGICRSPSASRFISPRRSRTLASPCTYVYRLLHDLLPDLKPHIFARNNIDAQTEYVRQIALTPPCSFLCLFL